MLGGHAGCRLRGKRINFASSHVGEDTPKDGFGEGMNIDVTLVEALGECRQTSKDLSDEIKVESTLCELFLNRTLGFWTRYSRVH